MRKKLRNNKGFTLIELMIVVVIIGILAALAIPRFTGATARAKEKEADGILKSYYTLQLAYSAKYGQFATNEAQFAEQVGWERPPRAENYQVTAAAFPIDATTPKVLTRTAGAAGYCNRQINMATGEISSVGC